MSWLQKKFLLFLEGDQEISKETETTTSVDTIIATKLPETPGQG